MNFLAHLYLSEPDARSLIGNILPDVVRPRKLGPDLDPVIHAGIRNHQRVDAFTDTHPLFLQSRARLTPRHGRFAGILVDMLYDHFLARDWATHHPLPLRVFSQQVHDALAAHREHLPPPMAEVVRVMLQQDWLCSYATRSGLCLALQRMSCRFSQRFAREVALHAVMDDLPDLDPDLSADFDAFFPQLVSFVRRPAATLRV